MKLLDSVLLFSGLAFLIMWVNEYIYKHVTFKDSYFFLMFSIALFLTYVYRRGQRKITENKQEPEPKKKITVKKK